MNIREIKDLLERYYEGETTPDEEKILKDFFLSGNVPVELEENKYLFRYFAEATGEELDDRELEEKVFGESKKVPIIPIRSRSNRLFYIAGIAASVLLLIGLFFTFRNDIADRKNREVKIANAELVYARAHDILAFVSVNFNRGMDKAQYIGKLDQAMQKMQMLSKYYQYQSLIINPDPFEKRSEKTPK
jgi:hypothetical protein